MDITHEHLRKAIDAMKRQEGWTVLFCITDEEGKPEDCGLLCEYDDSDRQAEYNLTHLAATLNNVLAGEELAREFKA